MSSNIEDKPRIYKGLAGVVVDTTAISKVVPETNSLTYRGYASRISPRSAASKRWRTCCGTANCPTTNSWPCLPNGSAPRAGSTGP